jgi:hypothetical protein
MPPDLCRMLHRVRHRAKPNAMPVASGEAAVARPIDRFDLFVRNAAHEAVELTLTRNARGVTVTLARPAYNGRRETVLDSIRPGGQDDEKILPMLESFDVWAMNAPDAPGAACKTVRGQRSCTITFNDYSLVMRVQRGREVRVQRYTGLEKSTSNQTARALGDFVFAWARRREGRGQHP